MVNGCLCVPLTGLAQLIMTGGATWNTNIDKNNMDINSNINIGHNRGDADRGKDDSNKNDNNSTVNKRGPGRGCIISLSAPD